MRHRTLPAAALAALLLVPSAAAATGTVDIAPAPPAPTAPPLPEWERAAYKTLTFQTAANLADAVLFGVIFATGAGTGAVFLVANTATAAALYYPYELAWDAYGPPPDAGTAQTLAAKTLGYQALTSARNLALSYAFSGSLLPSLGFVAGAFAVDTVIYAANDLAWDAFRPRAGP